MSKDKKSIRLKEGVYLLDESKLKKDESELKLHNLKEMVEKIQKENDQFILQRNEDIDKALKQYANKINQKNQKDLLNNFFNEKQRGYARSDEFEQQQHQEKVKKAVSYTHLTLPTIHLV